MSSGRARFTAVTSCMVALLWTGCLDNPGVGPPEGELNFPIAMGIGPSHLFVASSNFDLRYNSGSLQAYDIDRIVECDAACPECVLVPNEDQLDRARNLAIEPYLCEGLLSSEVLIGSFASDLGVAEDGDRIYLSIRSESNLTYVDFDPSTGRLSCGGEPGTFHRCTDAFRRGEDEVTSERNLELPLDPTGLFVGDYADLSPGGTGDFVLMAHSGGQVSLFVEVGSGIPALADVVEELPLDIQNINWDPLRQLAWLPSSTQPSIGRVGVAVDTEDPLRSFVFDAGSLFFSGIDTGGASADARDVAFGPDGSRAYILSRRPDALLSVDLDDTGNLLAIDQIVEVCVGASRVELATLAGRTVAIVSCFDNGSIYVIDAERAALLGAAAGGSGPFVMSVDEARGLLFITDFVSSVIRVMSLDPVARCLMGEPLAECAPELVTIVGIPRPVEQLR